MRRVKKFAVWRKERRGGERKREREKDGCLAHSLSPIIEKRQVEKLAATPDERCARRPFEGERGDEYRENACVCVRV